MPGTGLTSVGTTTTYMDKVRSGESMNYITDTGAANALVGSLTAIDGSNITVQDGLRVLVKTANALQAGANTFNLNGGGVKDIVKGRSGNNLQSAVLAGAILDMVYNGTKWLIIGE